MKLESLVIVDQHATVNLYLSLVLPARHAPEIKWIKSISESMEKTSIYTGPWGGQCGFISMLLSCQSLFFNWSEVVTR